MVKGLITWTGVVAFLVLTASAVNMGQWTIALVMGGLAFVCLLLAPPNGKSKPSKRGSRSRGEAGMAPHFW